MSETTPLGPAQRAAMRVAVAQDVIEQLKTGEIVAKSQVYCRFTQGIPAPEDVGRGLRELMAEKGSVCEVCAKGGLFVAHVKRYNEVTVGPHDHVLGDQEVCAPLTEFSADTLEAIEDLFEGRNGNRQYFREFPDAHARMIAIMQNIIDHKGDLELPEDYVSEDSYYEDEDDGYDDEDDDE